MLRLLAINLVMYSLANKSYGTEFNTHFIDAHDNENIDLTTFESATDSQEGDLFVDVAVNGRRVSRSEHITFLRHNDEVQACIPMGLIQKIGLREKVIKEMALWGDDACVDIKGLSDQTSIRLDQEKQELSISIPQSFFLYDDPNWVPPAQWDDGINGVVFDYSINQNIAKPKHGSSNHSTSATGTVGVNVGAWRLRADYQYSRIKANDKSKDEFQWSQAYAFRALPEIASNLVIGDAYLPTDVFETFRYRGIGLYSDEQMLPPGLRGYAPQITGIANTNAKVSISQQGRIIKQVTVPPGPFSIEGLSEAISGVLDVKIEEEDGSVSEYQVTSATMPFLTRKGKVRYKATAGQIKPLFSENVDQNFFAAEASYGLSNDTSVYGGVIATVSNDEYRALNAGVGKNLNRFGSVTADWTQSTVDLPLEGKRVGNSYRFNYSKRFNTTDSQITFTGYRFSDRNFMSVNRYVDIKSGLDFSNQEKNAFVVALFQYLRPLDVSLNLNAARRTYWDGAKNDSYNLYVSKAIRAGKLKGTSISFAAQKNKHRDYANNQYSLTMSVPLENRRLLSYSANYDNTRKRVENAVTYNGYSDGTAWSVGVRGNDVKFSEGVVTGSISRSFPQAEVQLFGTRSDHYLSAGATVNGSVTVTKHGAALHQRVYKDASRLMIDSGGVPGVLLNSGSARTNRLGLTAVGNMENFAQSDIYVDVNNLPEDISVSDNVISQTLTKGAIGYAKISATQGDQISARIALPEGGYPPFGVSVIDTVTGQPLGIVGDSGHAYLTGINANSVLTLKWGGSDCEVKVENSQYNSGHLNEFICERK